MRWPLRYQIMAPMMVAQLIVIGLLTGVQAYVAARSATQQIRTRLRDVITTIGESSFPVTDRTLRQMKGLAGADFVLADLGEGVVATTLTQAWDLSPVMPQTGDWTFAETVRIGASDYFHAAAPVRHRGSSAHLHVLYPVRSYRDAWQTAVRAPLLIGGLTLLVVAMLSAAIAARVTRPLDRLRRQVEEVSRGCRDPVALPPGEDEVRDLTISINNLSERLVEFEEQVRRTEQLRTLAQIGGGLAHQLRNAATGARMALDLHRRRCASLDSESLDVATRQLELMERYLQRFLRLGSPQPATWETLDLVEVVADLLPLVQPTAQHSGVSLIAELPDHPIPLWADRDGMQHLVLNLLLNAVEAASASGGQVNPRVRLALTREHDVVRLLVEDSGTGPAHAMQTRMFDPFVTDKSDGAGLGLSVARQVVLEHGGRLIWRRDDEQQLTRFVAELPVMKRNQHRGQFVGG